MTTLNSNPVSSGAPANTAAAPASVTAPIVRNLRDLVADRIGGRWDQWAAAHPHLAQVIDRTRLVESAVTVLRDDPAFIEALNQADLDESQLASAARVLDVVERLVARLLPLAIAPL